MSKSTATLRRWERKGWLKSTMGYFTEENLLKADKTARENRGGARTKGQRVNGESLEEANWPAEAVADGKAYSLEVSRAMEIVTGKVHPDDEPTPLLDMLGEIQWRPVEPNLTEPPEFERMTGTYTDVSRRAQQLNAKQQQCGFVAWIFYPAPLDPQKVA